MACTDIQANAYLDSFYGSGSPATIYFGLHLATDLAAQANSGQNQLSTNHAPPNQGLPITVDPDGPLEESFTVSNVTGAGPYTVTLSGNLANTHVAGTSVSYHPGNDGSAMREPVGNGYARKDVANNATEFPAATGRQQTNANQIDFAAASGGNWGLVTHVAVNSAVSGTDWRDIGDEKVPRVQVNDTDQVFIPAGQLIAQILATVS